MTNNSEKLRAAPLRIGISTRALFNLEEEHKIFIDQGVQAYSEYQRQHENDILAVGSGFNVVQQLLALNEPDKEPYVEVILLSRNSPDLSIRAFKSIEHYDLTVKKGSFISGRSLAPYIDAWNIDLFLSNEVLDVQAASTAAASLGPVSPNWQGKASDELRIAFDGDAVVFSPESDQIYKDHGLKAFFDHERENSLIPMAGGPFGEFLKKLSILRQVYMDDKGFSKVRIAIVTTRNAPAHERVINTLRAWGTEADEAHFVGSSSKTPILKAFAAHIFFDDQEKHVLDAGRVVPSGHVPGPHTPDAPIIPASV